MIPNKKKIIKWGVLWGHPPSPPVCDIHCRVSHVRLLSPFNHTACHLSVPCPASQLSADYFLPLLSHTQGKNCKVNPWERNTCCIISPKCFITIEAWFRPPGLAKLKTAICLIADKLQGIFTWSFNSAADTDLIACNFSKWFVFIYLFWCLGNEKKIHLHISAAAMPKIPSFCSKSA